MIDAEAKLKHGSWENWKKKEQPYFEQNWDACMLTKRRTDPSGMAKGCENSIFYPEVGKCNGEI